MRLQAGKTYITRNGIKRVARELMDNSFMFDAGYRFVTAPINGDGIQETYLPNGKFLPGKRANKYDLVAEVKKSVK